VETRDALVIEMELPGVAKSDVSITLLNNQELIVKGLKKQPRLEQEPVTYYLFEREFGTFFKKIVIDFPLDTTTVKSNMENGVLTIEVRKRNASRIAVEIK
jgi:HSP20 family protein